MNNWALKEVGLLATLRTERGQKNKRCIRDDGTELDAKRDMSEHQGKKNTQTRKHDEDDWKEEGWSIKSSRLVIPADARHKVLVRHDHPKRITGSCRVPHT